MIFFVFSTIKAHPWDCVFSCICFNITEIIPFGRLRVVLLIIIVVVPESKQHKTDPHHPCSLNFCSARCTLVDGSESTSLSFILSCLKLRYPDMLGMYLLLCALLGFLPVAVAHNIQMGAHQRECFHEVLHKDDKMTVTFQVGDREFGGAGNLELDFWVCGSSHS